MSEHTKEPWGIGRNGDNGIEITSNNGMYFVAEVTDEDDARRIVACVNACAGISNERLAGGVIASRHLTDAECDALSMHVMNLAAFSGDNEEIRTAIRQWFAGVMNGK